MLSAMPRQELIRVRRLYAGLQPIPHTPPTPSRRAWSRGQTQRRAPPQARRGVRGGQPHRTWRSAPPAAPIDLTADMPTTRTAVLDLAIDAAPLFFSHVNSASASERSE